MKKKVLVLMLSIIACGEDNKENNMITENETDNSSTIVENKDETVDDINTTPYDNMSQEEKNEALIKTAKNGDLVAVKTLVDNGADINATTKYGYTAAGNGFYEDNSYLQHGNIAYTGSYGNVLLDKLSNGVYVLSGTKWDLYSPVLYDWINKGIEPVIYKGFVFDNVRGRSLARYYGGYNRFGNEFIGSLLKINLVAENKDKAQLQSILKSWLVGSEDTFFVGNPGSEINIAARQILSDDSIKTIEKDPKHFAFNLMERNVHRRLNYTLTLARTSSRIAKNESINNENLKPWYQGDGMVSLYNDTIHYMTNYWPTVDSYRLPGVTRVVRPRNTTTSKIEMIDGKSTRIFDFPREDVSFNKHSGSVDLLNYGTASMTISNTNETLSGQKSWYMFDDEIVFVSTGISDDSSYGVETTLENRRLVLRKNELLVNNKKTTKYNGVAKIVYIQDTLPDTSLAYFFPKEIEIDFYRTNTSGAWFDINQNGAYSKDVEKNTFAILNYNHGIAPKNSSLIYYLIPNITPEQLESYEDPMTIVTQLEVHSVYHNNLKILGLNFFQKASFENISSEQALVYMQKETALNSYEVAINDPLFNESMISLTIDQVKEFTVPKEVNAVLEGDKLIISIDKARKGKIYSFTYTK